MKRKSLCGKGLLLLVFIYICLAVFSVGAGAESGSGTKISSRFYELLFGDGEEQKERTLIPGGDVFGVRITGSGVTVKHAEEGSPFRAEDRIAAVDGKRVTEAEEVRSLVEKSLGRTMRFEILRSGKNYALDACPARDENGVYRLGITLTDGAAGIGTVTFVDPETGAFGGLGHGISDAATGDVLPMTSGEVTGVILSGAVKGKAGAPGELRGVLTSEIKGRVDLNTECGVFGVLNGDFLDTGAALPAATREEVHEGDAVILSTVRSGLRAEYAVKIEEIDRDSTGTKSFRIRVTDRALIALTGGIVRGMSGSPILQDGKIVGAVTHVLVGDPTEGYGIFIENMLREASHAGSLFFFAKNGCVSLSPVL